jgi:hypothetical protein
MTTDGKNNVMVRVFNSYEIKDELKSNGYRFSGTYKCWFKVFTTFEEAEAVAKKF